MLIENGFELLLILLALTYTRFARLPLMVACNIFLFSYISLSIESNYDITTYPGYDIHYGAGGAYFLITAAIFVMMKNPLYKAVSVVLFLQAIASGVMLITDSFWEWHEFINDKSIVIECFIVWLSAIKDIKERSE